MAFPAGVYIEDEDWTVVSAPRTQDLSLSGPGQYAASLGDYWRASMTVVVDAGARMAWNAWVLTRRGALVPDTISPITGEIIGAELPITTGGGFSDGSTFSDGSVHSEGGPVTIRAAAIGATSLRCDYPGTGIPSYAWIGFASRLYMVTAVTLVSGTDYTLTIWPPLRAAVTEGQSPSATPSLSMRTLDAPSAPALSNGVARLRVTMEEVL